VATVALVALVPLVAGPRVPRLNGDVRTLASGAQRVAGSLLVRVRSLPKAETARSRLTRGASPIASRKTRSSPTSPRANERQLLGRIAKRHQRSTRRPHSRIGRILEVPRSEISISLLGLCTRAFASEENPLDYGLSVLGLCAASRSVPMLDLVRHAALDGFPAAAGHYGGG
jgi:hypothetical protein